MRLSRVSFILPSIVFNSVLGSACSPQSIDSAQKMQEIQEKWTEDNMEGSRLLLRRHDSLLDRITYRGESLSITHDIERFDIQEVEIPDHANIHEVIAELWATGEYEYVEPVLKRTLPPTNRVLFEGDAAMLRTTPNDTFYPYQPNMDIIQATDLPSTATGAGVVVAIIDTGVTTAGNDTPVNMLQGYDYVNMDTNAADDNGHGTHIAGTIAQHTNNNYGTIGIVPNASILPVKVLDAQGSGFSTDTILGIEFAVQQGADVINMSLGSDTPSSSEEIAVTDAINAGVVVVAANGNDGIQQNGVLYPAAYSGVIAVSATNMNGTITSYSNAGPETVLSAPGGELAEDLNNDGYGDGILQETINGGSMDFYFYEGTSMATPHVAGAVASLISAGASGSEAVQFLEQTASDLGTAGEDDLYGVGEIRIYDALQAYLSTPSVTSVNSLQVGDLVISEIMVDPNQVADYRGEWFEIHNTTNNTVDLQGLVVGGNTDTGFTVSSQVLVDAQGYAVFAVRSGASENGGLTVDYTYAYSTLSFAYADTLSISYGSTTFDSVSFTTQYQIFPGASMYSSSLNATTNNGMRDWCTATSTYGLGDYGTPGSANDTCNFVLYPNQLVAGDLVISEFMTDPTMVADYRGEWFEVYNNTSDTINLKNLQILSGGDTGFTVGTDALVAPSSYALFANRDTPSLNGGLPTPDVVYDYNICKFGATDSLTLKYNTTTIDTVSFNATSFPIVAGASASVSSLDATDNNSGLYWCEATSSYGLGDFGTPKADNDSCPVTFIPVTSAGVGDLIITEIMFDPTRVVDYRGEWFEIYNASGIKINLNGLQVRSAGDTGFNVTTDLQIASGEYLLFANRSESGVNGGMSNVDYIYNYNLLKFGGADSLTIQVSGTTLDTVTFNSQFGTVAGHSIATSTLSATANDSAGNWCAETATYGSGDFGTPGEANTGCN